MERTQSRLPGTVLEGLLAGGCGPLHLLRLVGQCFKADGPAPEVRLLGIDLLRAAWEADPLDAGLGAQLLALAPETGNGHVSAALHVLGGAQPTHPEAERAARLAARGDAEQACAVLADALAEAPGEPRLLRQGLDVAWRYARPGWGAALLERPWPAASEPLRRLCLGGMLLLAGDCLRAHDEFAACLKAWPLPTAAWRLGECLLRLGRRQAGLDALLAAHHARPWNIGPLLRAHDAALGLDTALRPLDGPLAVLLYTWNKAPLLDATLAALFASELGDARVFVLNNGSSDGTDGVLSAWGERAGPKRLTRIDLPVNVGAPAARNWLARLPEVAACRYAAYLDDDALPPPDWIGRLGAAVAAHPAAGAYGCKVVDADAPAVVQNADLHLRLDAQAGLALSDLHLLEPDYGQFDYLRPCVSVTGCCHLFRTRVLERTGGFEIALSPSQFDDVEHDLRLNLAGLPAVYQGRLAVRHARRSGGLAQVSPRAAASAHGNWEKLTRLHPARAVRDIIGQDTARLAEDLRRKADALGPEWGPGPLAD